MILYKEIWNIGHLCDGQNVMQGQREIFLRKYCLEDLYDKEQAQYIIEKELPYQLSEFIRSYSEAANNAWQQMYVAT